MSENSIGKFFGIVVLVITLFFVPVLLVSFRIEIIIQSQVESVVNEYTDNWRASGRITLNDYKEMYSKVSKFMDADVEITHASRLAGFEGAEYEYYHYYNTQDILDTLSPLDNKEGNDYYLRNGDYLSVQVKNANPTYATKIARIVFKSLGNTSIYYPYGGMVGNYSEE